MKIKNTGEVQILEEGKWVVWTIIYSLNIKSEASVIILAWEGIQGIKNAELKSRTRILKWGLWIGFRGRCVALKTVFKTFCVCTFFWAPVHEFSSDFQRAVSICSSFKHSVSTLDTFYLWCSATSDDVSRCPFLFISPVWDSLYFLYLRIGILHQFWNVLSHFLFHFLISLFLPITQPNVFVNYHSTSQTFHWGIFSYLWINTNEHCIKEHRVLLLKYSVKLKIINSSLLQKKNTAQNPWDV